MLNRKLEICISAFFIMFSLPVCAQDNVNLPTLGENDVYFNNTNSKDGAKENAKESRPLPNQAAQVLVDEAQQNFQNMNIDGVKSEFYQYGKNLAIDTVQSGVESLLSPYGHVRTSININDNAGIDGSSLDYFLPWYAGESTLLFNQLSAHSKDGRQIANLGVGVRYNLNKDLLVGINSFYDYDLSRGHRRAGVGTEIWTHYLKLSGNYYLPLSQWKRSDDLKDFEEKPAEGWDMRVQAYIPAYPQLGASVVYEQYYGDKVALFDTDSLEKDPSAVTLGVSYTPVPLISMDIGYKQGNRENAEVTANLMLDYQIGVPFARQMDPSAVAEMRTLAGNRMDFVDRNNDIVLEYREIKDLDIETYLKPTGTAPQCIITDQPDTAEAYEGCHWTLNAIVQSHLKIKSARWVSVGGYSATSLFGLPALAPQSNINTGKDNHWSLTFPAWNNAKASDANQYQLAVTVVDEKGHSKQSNVVTIKVVEAPVNYQLLIVNSPSSNKIISQTANGKSTVDLAISGKKMAGVNGETTNVAPDKLDMNFHAYPAEDKNFEHEIIIHSSKNECTKAEDCIFYTKSPEHGAASIASTLPGQFVILGSPSEDDSKKSNPVFVNFTAGNRAIVTAIVDVTDPTVDLTSVKESKLSLGHEYQFKVAYDSNNNGKWDASDSDSLPDKNATPLSSLITYKWFFDGVNALGEKGGYANPSTNNHNLIIPADNSKAVQVLASAGNSGVQGYDLKVDFTPLKEASALQALSENH